jgi:hypothetical protein
LILGKEHRHGANVVEATRRCIIDLDDKEDEARGDGIVTEARRKGSNTSPGVAAGPVEEGGAPRPAN